MIISYYICCQVCLVLQNKLSALSIVKANGTHIRLRNKQEKQIDELIEEMQLSFKRIFDSTSLYTFKNACMSILFI